MKETQLLGQPLLPLLCFLQLLLRFVSARQYPLNTSPDEKCQCDNNCYYKRRVITFPIKLPNLLRLVRIWLKCTASLQVSIGIGSVTAKTIAGARRYVAGAIKARSFFIYIKNVRLFKHFVKEGN